MKVLHIQKAAGLAGSERHLLSLLPALVERGVGVRVCVLAAEHGERFSEGLRTLGIETIVIPAGRHANPFLPVRLLREIRRFGPDIVHTHLIHGDFYGQIATRLAGVPGISSVHGTYPFCRKEPFRSAARLAGHLARRTIAISHHVRRFIEELGLAPSARVRVIYYGIDTNGWQLPEAARHEAREKFGCSDGEFVVGMASRLVPFKGHDFVLDALAEALPQSAQIRLLIAGDGPLRGDLESRVRASFANGIVRFTGYISEVKDFMNACDVIVFPTLPDLSEGFGLAALEAMAAARPVIATRVGALPELVEHLGAGFLVNPGDVKELAAALTLLARDTALRVRLAEGARKRARAHFSLDAATDRVLTTYAEAR